MLVFSPERYFVPRGVQLSIFCLGSFGLRTGPCGSALQTSLEFTVTAGWATVASGVCTPNTGSRSSERRVGRIVRLGKAGVNTNMRFYHATRTAIAHRMTLGLEIKN